MKKITKKLLFLFGMMFLASCARELPDNLKNTTMSEGEQSVTKYLRASVGSLSFKASEGSETITITSNVSWSIQCDQTWCRLSSSSGSNNGTVIVNVSENTSTTTRNAIITISSNDANSVQISVSQGGASPVLQLNKNDLSFTASYGNDSFTITSNTSWTITSDQSWCTVSSSSGSGNATITVSVQENASLVSRSATITVIAGNITQTISINQAGTVNQSTRTFTVNGVSFNMILVDGGTFMMGATSEQGDDAYDREKPTHRVTLSPYYMGETEVTQALWLAVMSTTPSHFNGQQRPVECISWDDCQKFIQKLNKLTGQNFRLPTEAEWEYAARGGNYSRGFKYAGSNIIGNVAWYEVNSYDVGSSSFDYGTHVVATKTSNELGFYDLSGNVYEWCQDRYSSYSSSSQTNPTGPSSGNSRVSRGGCWSSSERSCRVSLRRDNVPDFRDNSIGLRLAL